MRGHLCFYFLVRAKAVEFLISQITTTRNQPSPVPTTFLFKTVEDVELVLRGQAAAPVRLLEVAIPEELFAEGDRSGLRVGKGGFDGDELLDSVPQALSCELYAYHQVDIEIGTNFLVGADFPDLRRQVDDDIWSTGEEQPSDQRGHNPGYAGTTRPGSQSSGVAPPPKNSGSHCHWLSRCRNWGNASRYSSHPFDRRASATT